MDVYVASGNMINDGENRYTSGTKLPDKVVAKIGKDNVERLVLKGTLRKQLPTLDAVVDSKTGSAAIAKNDLVPKKEDFASKQLNKETLSKPKRKTGFFKEKGKKDK